MSIREVFDSPGSFRVRLRDDTPSSVRKAINPFDHLVILAQGAEDHTLFDDATLLAEARFAGPIMRPIYDKGPFVVEGHGMGWHLGDTSGNGPIAADTLSFTDATLTTLMDTIANGGILPPSLAQGTITNPSATFTGTFYPADTSLAMVRTVMETLDCHYRINPDGTVDAGPTSSNEVYLMNEDDGGTMAVAVREGWGSDPKRVSIEEIQNRTVRDGKDWVSRVVVIDDQYDGTNTLAYFQDRASNPYYDIQGNPLIRNKIISRPASDDVGLDTYASRQLAQANVTEQITIDLNQWEIARGTIQVGDNIWVYDPEAGITDQTYEISHRGQIIWPIPLRITEADWPLVEGMEVLVRPGATSVSTEDYIVLTPFVEWERTP